MEKAKEQRTDELLVKLSQEGDEQARNELCLRHAGLVRGCAHRFFIIGGEAEDLIQEGMLGLFNAVMSYKETEAHCSFKTFAKLCVSRRLIDAVKSAARKKNAPLNAYMPITFDTIGGISQDLDDGLIWEEEQREIRQMMSGVLSDFEFKVTTMYMDGMSCLEISKATGKPMKSVDNALQRGKKKLQEVFKR